MRTGNYVYFAVKSEVMTGPVIGQRIGLAADRAKVRGSKVIGPPPHPLAHTWEIIGDEPGLRVHDQITRVMDRIRPYQLAIRDFVSRMSRPSWIFDGGPWV